MLHWQEIETYKFDLINKLTIERLNYKRERFGKFKLRVLALHQSTFTLMKGKGFKRQLSKSFAVEI